MRGAMMLMTLYLFASTPVFASDGALGAERYRLEIELERHAGASRWKGVERSYEKLLGLQVPLTCRSHFTAALAAESQGDLQQTWVRLERAIRHKNALLSEVDSDGLSYALTVPNDVDISSADTKAAILAYNSLNTRYGRVSISVGKGRIPALIRMGQKPFGSTERGAIITGQRILADKERFVGLLPVGRYMVDGEMFQVASGELTVVKVATR